MNKELLQQTLDALIDSLDSVQTEHAIYLENYGDYPSRKARIDGLKSGVDKHIAAIKALEVAIAQPMPATVQGEPVPAMIDMSEYVEQMPDGSYRPIYKTDLPAATSAKPAIDIKEFTDRVFRLTDGVKYALEQNKLDDAISARLDLESFLQKAIAQPMPAEVEPDFYEDVYDQCCEAIKPLVDAGKLPGSVVGSMTLLIKSFNNPKAEGDAKDAPYDPRMMYAEKDKGVLEMRISGLSMRAIKDIFELEYGAVVWSEGVAYPADKVVLKFTRADFSDIAAIANQKGRS